MGDTYAIGSLTIDVACEDATVTSLVAARLGSLRCDAVEAPDIRVTITGPEAPPAAAPRPSGAGRPIYDAPGQPIEYFDDGDELYVDFEGEACLLSRPAEGRIAISITGSRPADEVLAAHPLLTLALLEAAKRFGHYPLHAAAAALGGRGILVPGTSGAGKSTLSVTLVRAGFSFLSDDTVFLTEMPEGVWVSGFPDEVDVTEGTVAMFEELSHLSDLPMRPGRDKHAFRVEDVYGVTPLAGCRPAVLVFPMLDEGPSPSLRELPAAEALVRLTPNLLLTEPQATQAHLDMIGSLVRSVPSFDFRPGRNFEAAAASLADLVS